VLQLVGPAFTIALLGAIESLLTAVVADGMTGARHNPNQELIGQGAANILSPLFGGFAATGAVARTATSIRNGATSPLAGIVHAVFLILVILLLAPWAAHIPLAALAAILFYVAWNMSDVRHFRGCSPRAALDRLVLLITFGLTVFVDLVVAVNVGVVIAALMFMRRMAESVSVQQEVFGGPEGRAGEGEAAREAALPPNVLVYRIDGPFFFGAAEKLESTIERAQLHVGTVVIRLGRVPFMDATGMHTLSEIIERFQRQGIRVLVCGIQEALSRSLSGPGSWRWSARTTSAPIGPGLRGASRPPEPLGRGIVKIERGGAISGRMPGSGDSLVLSCLARCAASARLLTRSSHHEKHRRTSRWKSACCHLSYCE
jgi:SulP family sulfate permease